MDELTDIYTDWCEQNGLPKVAAEEQDWEKLTPEQHAWLSQFIEQWDRQQELVDRLAALRYAGGLMA